MLVVVVLVVVVVDAVVVLAVVGGCSALDDACLFSSLAVARARAYPPIAAPAMSIARVVISVFLIRCPVCYYMVRTVANAGVAVAVVESRRPLRM